MPESLEEIATCALYEPTAQREAVLAREIIAIHAEMKRFRQWMIAHEHLHDDALESAGARGEGEQPFQATAEFAVAELADARRERDEAQRDLASRMEKGQRQVERLMADRDSWRRTCETITAERDALQQQLAESRVTCPICEHPWQMHDPDDGKCDHATGGGTVFGPCQCGRDLTWMRSHIARLSTDALAATTPTAGGS